MSNTSTTWTWKNEPELMARLLTAQNHPAHEHRDVMTFVGFITSTEELLRHVLSCEAQAAAYVPKRRRGAHAA